MKAHQVRRLIAQEYQSVLNDVDVIAGPSAPNIAFILNDNSVTDMYMRRLHHCANLAGLPAISVPVGLVDGLPVGMHHHLWFSEAAVEHRHQLEMNRLNLLTLNLYPLYWDQVMGLEASAALTILQDFLPFATASKVNINQSLGGHYGNLPPTRCGRPRFWLGWC